MEAHERRKPLPPAKERSIELLIYGTFADYDDDPGYFSTRWVHLDDLQTAIGREAMTAKLASFRDGLVAALEAAIAPPATEVG